MFEGLLLPWQQIYHLTFYSIFRTTPEVSSKLTLLKYVKSKRSYGFLIARELIFGCQILDLKDHFSASLRKYTLRKRDNEKFQKVLFYRKTLWWKKVPGGDSLTSAMEVLMSSNFLTPKESDQRFQDPK